MKKNRKMRMYPYPVLLFLGAFIYEALIGEDRSFGPLLFISLLFIGLWYLLCPPLTPPPTFGAYYDPTKVARGDLQQQQKEYASNLAGWAWEYNMHTDRAFRDKHIAAALALIPVGVGLLWFFGDKEMIPERAVLIDGLCVLGELLLLLDVIVLRLRGKREKKDRSKYPLPTVNMTFDEAAVEDGRAHALEARLRQLEAWRQNGMIGQAEYEHLRKKYLRLHGASEGGQPGKK